MNLALVGHGAMGTEHLEVLLELGGVAPYVVAGPNAEVAERYARRYGFARSATEVEAALTDPQVDLVVIASPNASHASQAEQAIRAGKHVLIEIPIAMTLAEAEELAKLASASSGTVMAGHTSRYYPAVRDLVGRIDDGTLHPRHVVCAMGTDKRRDRNWKGEPRDWTDDLLWHHGLHVFDTVLLLYPGDRVVATSIQSGRRHPDHGGEMELSASLRFAGGGLATIALTYEARAQFTRYTVIADEAFLDYAQGAPPAGPYELTMGGTFRELIHRQDRDFLSACLDGTPSPIPLDSVLPSMRLLDVLQQQLDEQQKRHVPDPSS